MKCQLTPVNRMYGRCTVCLRLARYACGDTDRECSGKPQPMGLGDMVAAGLSVIGITKERVSALVGGDCGCEQRQEWVNELGRAVGIGTPKTPSERT
jgi:hypothetical protein